MKRLTWVEWLLLVIVALHALWPVLWGELTLLPILDYIDANHPIQYRLSHDSAAFAGTDVQFNPLLGGSISRATLASDLSLIFWLYRLAPSALASLQLLHFLIVASAMGSMWLLLRELLPKPEAHKWAIPLAACYALVPFFQFFALGISAMPLVAVALIRLHKNARTPWAWCVLVLYPLCAPVHFTTLFVCLAGGIIAVLLTISLRKIQWSLLGWLALMMVVALLAEWRLVMYVLSGDMAASHRSEFVDGYNSLNIKGFVLEVAQHYFQFESNSYDRFPVGILGLGALGGLLYFWARGSDREKRWAALGLATALATFLCTSLELVLGWGLIRGLVEAYYQLPLARSLSLGRFFTLVPLGWTVVLGITGALITAKCSASVGTFYSWLSRALPTLTVIVFLTQQWPYYEPYARYYFLLSSQSSPRDANAAIRATWPNVSSYAQYTTPELWLQALRQIPEPLDRVRVCSVGSSPSIALLYGLNTLDGYWNVIPLDYKRSFRKVIAGELARDSSLQKYYDNWGSRMYLFSAELFQPEVRRGMFAPGYGPDHLSPAFNTDALRKLSLPGTSMYLFSAHVIDNADSLSLVRVSTIRHSLYAQRIHLYRLSTQEAR